jgi:hypothetical protein
MKTCKDISELLSESMDRQLIWCERLTLWVHLSMCRRCSGFQKNLHFLHKAAGRHRSN